jgi:hypothetical protein
MMSPTTGITTDPVRDRQQPTIRKSSGQACMEAPKEAPKQGRRESMTKALVNWVTTGPERAYLGTQAALQVRPTWNAAFRTSVGLLKAGAYSLPRNVEAIRVVTDHAIPNIILPKDVRIDALTLVPADSMLPPVRAERYCRRAYRAHPVHNSERSSCAACNTSFGLITRKSHCRLCGEIFCRSCAPKRLHPGSVPLVGPPCVRCARFSRRDALQLRHRASRPPQCNIVQHRATRLHLLQLRPRGASVQRMRLGGRSSASSTQRRCYNPVHPRWRVLHMQQLHASRLAKRTCAGDRRAGRMLVRVRTLACVRVCARARVCV